jgi:5-methylcytosine-specific restriction endonuclease McrA
MWLFGHKKLGFVPDVAVPEMVIIEQEKPFKHTCVGCGKIFGTKINNSKFKYCSTECRENKLKKDAESLGSNVSYYKKCLKCHEWFIANRRNRVYCNSYLCHSEIKIRADIDLFADIDLEYYFEKCNWTCFICLKKFMPNFLSPHHIIPLALGGKTNEGNTVILCHECHGRQHTKKIWNQIRYDKSSAMKLLLEQQQKYIDRPFYGMVLYRH